MKNSRYELFGRMQRQYHKNQHWSLSQGGLYVPHSYADMNSKSLSWWGDVGFILNGRRVIVWWQHPRHVYSEALDAQSWQEAGEWPKSDWLADGRTKNYRSVGASRKKIVSYTVRQPPAEQRRHYDLVRDIRKRLTTEGIDLDVLTSWARQRLTWATGVSLVAPLEVRNEDELATVALLARRLILGQTTLEAEFPQYLYSRANWLGEQEKGLDSCGL